MKTIRMGLLALTAMLMGCATMMENDLTPDQAKVVRVFESSGQSKDRLFVIANSWAVDTFVSAESVIEFSDKEAGMIKGKYTTDFIEGVYVYSLKSTFTVEVKDGAARITIADPYFKATSGMGQAYNNVTYSPMRSSSSFEKNCRPKYEALAASFGEAVKTPTSTF